MLWFIGSIVLLFVLLGGGLWIAFAIGISSVFALYPIIQSRIYHFIGLTSWETSTTFVVGAVPLFVLMGEIISSSGLTDRLYSGLTKSFRGVKGGLVQTNIVIATIFAASTGSSVASAATIGRIAYEEQVLRRKYDAKLVVGSIAAGGTLGILIPPSIPLIIYGSIAEQSVGRLFMAGLIPGLAMSALFMCYIAIRAMAQPHIFPREEVVTISWRERLGGLFGTLPFVVLAVAVLGSIYGGIATPTESAAIGVVGVLALAAAYRRLTLRKFTVASLSTVKTTAMVFLILISGKIMAIALAYYRISPMIAAWGAGMEPWMVFVFVNILYLILGCFFEPLSMMLLTLPFVIPMVQASGFNLIWFGIILVIQIEMSMLTPPVGMNLFVLQTITGESFATCLKGSYPFLGAQVLLIVLLWVFPQLALWLPSMMMK